MAVSAAFPGAVGPLVIAARDYSWKKRPHWDAPPGSEREVKLAYQQLHIYDGGLYDNLALEPLMDPGVQEIKNGIEYVICSDAGAPLGRTSPGSSLNPFRVKRILDIALDQTRALRIRALSKFLERNPGAGAYAQIGAEPLDRIRRYEHRNPTAAAELMKKDWLTPQDIWLAAAHPTTLVPLTEEQYERLERHGYESLQWNERLFRPTD